MNKRIIKIKLKAFCDKTIDKASTVIVLAALRAGAKVIGPVPMPRKRRWYTVNRSPHVNKKSREQFEIREHKRLIFIEALPQAITALEQLDVAAGVNIEVKVC